MEPSKRKLLIALASLALLAIFVFTGLVLSSISSDVKKAQELESRLRRFLQPDCASCYINVFGGDKRVFVYDPEMQGETIFEISEEAFFEPWVHELDVRNTNLGEIEATELISRHSNKRILTRFNSDHVDPFLYD